MGNKFSRIFPIKRALFNQNYKLANYEFAIIIIYEKSIKRPCDAMNVQYMDIFLKKD